MHDVDAIRSRIECKPHISIRRAGRLTLSSLAFHCTHVSKAADSLLLSTSPHLLLTIEQSQLPRKDGHFDKNESTNMPEFFMLVGVASVS
jgi:hypothetical protein